MIYEANLLLGDVNILNIEEVRREGHFVSEFTFELELLYFADSVSMSLCSRHILCRDGFHCKRPCFYH